MFINEAPKELLSICAILDTYVSVAADSCKGVVRVWEVQVHTFSTALLLRPFIYILYICFPTGEDGMLRPVC